MSVANLAVNGIFTDEASSLRGGALLSENGRVPKRELYFTLSGIERWESVTGGPPPDSSLERFSPLYFSRPLYEEILGRIPYEATSSSAPAMEQAAFKLAVLFKSLQEVDTYLKKIAGDIPGSKYEDIVLQATDFELPEDGPWSVKKWKHILLRYGERARPYIEMAPRLEKIAKLFGEDFPTTLRALRRLQVISKYKRSEENVHFALEAARYGISEEYFNGVLDHHESTKEYDLLPEDLLIDGDDIGLPGYYMHKLERGNLIGYLLGDITNCCQHLFSGGDDATIYGMESPYSGFYVWRKKTCKGEMNEDDPIVAHSWAWISRGDAIVFDSFEPPSRYTYDDLCQPFLEQFSYHVVGKHSFRRVNEERLRTVRKVTLGTAGNTPRGLKLRRLFFFQREQPIDYHGKRDSAPGQDGGVHVDASQYNIKRVDHRDRKAEKKHSKNSLTEAAYRQIQTSLRRIKEEHRLQVISGIEMECYALNGLGRSSPNLIKVDLVARDLKSQNLARRFEDENGWDNYGQYEMDIGKGDPEEIARKAKKAQSYVLDRARDWGAHSISFEASPFRGKPPSSTHVSISLLDEDGEPVLADEKLCSALAEGIVSVQDHLMITFAQNSKDYSRYYHTDQWSPKHYGVGTVGNTGCSLRIANSNNCYVQVPDPDPTDIRLENRLPAASSDPVVAMAGTLICLEDALNKAAKGCDSKKDTQVPLPTSKHVAVSNFNLTMKTDETLRALVNDDFVAEVLALQYDV